MSRTCTFDSLSSSFNQVSHSNNNFATTTGCTDVNFKATTMQWW
jgi:hypothetical protein